MKLIKRLQEGLGDFPAAESSQALYDAGLKGNSREGGQKEADLIVQQVEEWDPKELTKNFRSVLERRISSKGWDSADYFLIWLRNTDDNNIKALDADSAEALMEILDKNIKSSSKIYKDGDLIGSQTIRLNSSPYMIEDNGLFSGSSEDIRYKLNALAMILDHKISSQYIKLDEHGDPLILDDKGQRLTLEQREVTDKHGDLKIQNVYINDNGQVIDPKSVQPQNPSISDMAAEDGKFYPTNKIKANLDGYAQETFELPTRNFKGTSLDSKKDTSPEQKGKRTSNKPTLYSLLTTQFTNVKPPKDRSISFNMYSQSLRQFFANCFLDYYMKKEKVKDYKERAEKDYEKLSKFLNQPEKYADAFWNIVPNTSKNISDIGAAIINQFFKDPTGQKNLK